MNTLLLALASVLLSVAAQFSLKAGMMRPEVQAALADPLSLRTAVVLLSSSLLIGGFMLYGLGALVWLGVLARWDVSKAYPLVGLGFLMTAMVGVLIGEQVSLARVTGVALIAVGVFLVGRS